MSKSQEIAERTLATFLRAVISAAVEEGMPEVMIGRLLFERLVEIAETSDEDSRAAIVEMAAALSKPQ